MTSLVIKNVPADLHEQLRRRSQQNHRSMTREAIALLERGLAAPSSEPFRLPPLVRLKGGPLTLEQVDAAIGEGRS